MLQAVDAIQILCVEVLDRERFSAVNWDACRLGIRRLEPGHADVATTMIYTHVLNKPGVSIRTPLD